MPRYVALIRAINVGGRGVVRMAELRKVFESLGFGGVATYIQTGNVLFTSSARDRARLATRIEKAMQRAFGRAAKAFVLSPAELEKAAGRNPFGPEGGSQRCHMMFLSGEPARERREALMALQGDDYRFRVRGRALYYAYPSTLAGRRRTIDFEKVLGVTGTARSSNVVNELIRLSASLSLHRPPRAARPP